MHLAWIYTIIRQLIEIASIFIGPMGTYNGENRSQMFLVPTFGDTRRREIRGTKQGNIHLWMECNPIIRNLCHKMWSSLYCCV